MTELLSRYAPRLGIPLSADQLAQFAEYTRLLLDANRRVNLTAVTDPDEIQVRHYLDSLTAVLALPEWPDGRRVVDIGAGAGFPGIPLKIAFPGIRLTLADSGGQENRLSARFNRPAGTGRCGGGNPTRRGSGPRRGLPGAV